MQIKPRKLLSTLLACALAFTLFAALPMSASAADANNLTFQINNTVSHGGEGTLFAARSGNTVTVTGSVSLAVNPIELNIDSGVTVIWKAYYVGNVNAGSMIKVSGGGTFEIATNENLKNLGTGAVIETAGATVIITDSGAKVRNEGSGYAILASAKADIIVGGGYIYADNNYTIAVKGSGATVKIDGGGVGAVKNAAIGVEAANVRVEVISGNVSTSHDTIGIAVNAANVSVLVNGGLVEATNLAAIAVGGNNSTVTLSGGLVYAHGTGITGADNVINMVNGGSPSIGENAMVIAFNKPPSGIPEYNTGSKTDLSVSPAGAVAVWRLRGISQGISYSSGKNIGFYLVNLNDARVNATPGELSMLNFVKSRTYTPGMFTDVSENAWYGYNQLKVIADAYEYGLMSGNSNTTFNPAGNITIAEAITVASRVNCIYRTGHQLEFTPVPGDPWYMGNVRYAIDNGIIKANDFSNYTAVATRAQMAYIFARTLPSYEYISRWHVKTPPDVNSSTPYYNEIFRLYDSGILGGSDGNGTFYPGNNITRAEAAAILVRLILPKSRLGTGPMPS